ncbi:MAG: DUF1800 domain-containing protein [Pseudarcicella sp.]|nr:DUF1800 domain-containing protein [Pseudarcicella sp.]MBP6410976.1 DUF1800 domain-containing protein [Pseudarcicella sp.]
MALTDLYTNPLSSQQVAHLLRRASFGGSPIQIKELTGKTASYVVDILLAPQPELPDPKDYDGHDFVKLPWGAPETDQTLMQTLDNKRRGRVRTWSMNLMIERELTLLEKTSLFWQNHFVTTISLVQESRFIYQYIQTIRKHALGNFKEFVLDMTKAPAMLKYLDNNENIVGKPNENFARELQELFTIGDGNYTEDDVKMAAKVLTGWVDTNYRNKTKAGVGHVFDLKRHDTSDKVFSSFYGNKVIKGGKIQFDAINELNQLVDMILAQNETALFIIRKLYRWFINSEISLEAERDFIKPLANDFRKNYEIKPLLSSFFKSKHFFDEAHIGVQIKSPLDLMIGTLRSFEYLVPDESTGLKKHIDTLTFFTNKAREMEMNLIDQPSVFGWSPYYELQYDKLWISASTLLQRNLMTDSFTTGLPVYNLDFKVLNVVSKLPNPNDPATIVNFFVEWLIAVPITDAQKLFLTDNVLLSGTTTRSQWDTDWKAYKANPSNALAIAKVKPKINNLLKYIFRLAEYQLN